LASGAKARNRFVGEITITAITGFIGAAQGIVSIGQMANLKKKNEYNLYCATKRRK
jgi:hypothetical protein